MYGSLTLLPDGEIGCVSAYLARLDSGHGLPGRRLRA